MRGTALRDAIATMPTEGEALEFVLLSSSCSLFAFSVLSRMVLTTIRVRTGFDCIFVRVTHGAWWSMVRSGPTLLPPQQLWLKSLGVRQWQQMLICPDCLRSVFLIKTTDNLAAFPCVPFRHKLVRRTMT